MYIGRLNIGADFIIEGSAEKRTTIALSSGERDLGVEISKDLKPYNQVCKVASAANRMLGLLRNTFVSREAGLWKRQYTTFIRPHLKYAIKAWNSNTKKDIKILERSNVEQRRSYTS